MKNNERRLIYSIRKLKTGVGALLIATMLMGGYIVMTNAMEIVSAETINSDSGVPVEKVKEIYNKIIELIEANRDTYAQSFRDSIGQELKKLFEDPNTPADVLHDKLLHFTSYGLIIKDGVPIQPKSLTEFEGYLEKDYTSELQKQKAKQKEVIAASKASDALKTKYNTLLDNATKLSVVVKEIPMKFQSDLNTQLKEKLQQAIEEAIDEINKMAYLKERKPHIELVEKASSEEEVKSYLEAAKRQAEIDKLNHENIEKIRKEINGLPYLTSDDKSRYNGLLDNSDVREAKNLLENAKQKNKENHINKLLTVAETIKDKLSELRNLPETPSSDEYNYQKELWKQLSTLTEKIVKNATKKNLENKDAAYLRTIGIKLSDVLNYTKIEIMTRKAALIRKKYPNSEAINRLFNQHLKQSQDNNYASQEGELLTHYVNTAESEGLNQIKRIEQNLDIKTLAHQQLDNIIAQLADKPLSEEVIKELEKMKKIIATINETLQNIQSIVDLHMQEAQKQVMEYTNKHKEYTEIVKKGLEDLQKEINRLKVINQEKATKLAEELLKEGKMIIDSATLSGENEYKKVIPAMIEKITAQVNQYLATHRPLISLEPSITQKIETEVKEVDYTVQEIENADLPKGVRRIKVAGQKGLYTITYSVRRKGDAILSRAKVSETVTKQVIDEIVEVGTKEVGSNGDKHQPLISNKKNTPLKNMKETLPNTGEHSSLLAVVIGTVMMVISTLLLSKKRNKLDD